MFGRCDKGVQGECNCGSTHSYYWHRVYRVTIKEIDTFNVIKTVSVVDTQLA
jgi:phage tail tube protein FII